MVYYIKDKIQLINKNETSKEESKESFEFDFYEEHQHLQYFIFADQFISEELFCRHILSTQTGLILFLFLHYKIMNISS